MKKFYITAAIPYVNAHPHIGHALEFVQADTIARYHKLQRQEVMLLSGGDENAIKNVQAAEKLNVPLEEFVNQNTQKFYELTQKLNCNFNTWQKGSDQKKHFPGCQKLWELCDKNGDIYQKTYKGLYCVGCEAFYTPSELQNGECAEHPGKKLLEIEEKNYFFKLSKYQKQIIELIETDKMEIVPEKRKHEVLSFLKQGLEDISISRSNERAKNWGVPVPNDNTQRMYVWFDALNIYQTGIGFGWDKNNYNKWWPADVHVIGKGIIRFHAVYWPAFLLSAKLDLPKKIFVHDYFTVNGQKMSKTLGNVVDPFTIIEKYGPEALRYFLLARFSPFSDGDFSEKEFQTVYNADLANGLGNLTARIAKLCEKIKFHVSYKPRPIAEEYLLYLKTYEFNKALEFIWNKIKKMDQHINEIQPWKFNTENGLEVEKLADFLLDAVLEILDIADLLQPFLPETSGKIIKQFCGSPIKSGQPLFPRIK